MMKREYCMIMFSSLKQIEIELENTERKVLAEKSKFSIFVYRYFGWNLKRLRSYDFKKKN